MSRRALRRSHKDRMKAKARRLYWWNPRAHHYADNLTLCSRHCCGNPRRFFKGEERFTMQERRHMNGFL